MHLLSGVDDGTKTEQQMQELLDAAYADGTRIICATPHFHPGYFGDNRNAVEDAFTELKNYAKKYSDLQLFLGNELRYSTNCLDWLNSGHCMTLNGSRYVLVDFLESDDSEYIVSSVLKLLNAGYAPILAHAERYENFHGDMREIVYLQECGVVIQVDAQSPFAGWGRGSKQRSRRIIENYLADVIASDAHDVLDRPPQMSVCYNYVENKCDEEYARQIFLNNPLDILNDLDISQLNLDTSYKELYSSITIENPDNTRILEVTVETKDAMQSKKIVDAICRTAADKINDTMGIDQVNVYSAGTVGNNPSNSMQMTTYLLIGIVVAMIVYSAYLIAFILDDKIKTEEDVAKYLGLSVLGEIPNSKNAKKNRGKYQGYYSNSKKVHGGKSK